MSWVFCDAGRSQFRTSLKSPARATCSGRTPTVFWRWIMSKRSLFMPLLQSALQRANLSAAVGNSRGRTLEWSASTTKRCGEHQRGYVRFIVGAGWYLVWLLPPSPAPYFFTPCGILHARQWPITWTTDTSMVYCLYSRRGAKDSCRQQ